MYVNTTAAEDAALYRQMQSIHRHWHWLTLSRKLCKVTLNLGAHFIFFFFFCEDSKKLICNPDTNKQLMHKYAHNFKTKGEQLYRRCKGGISFLIKAAQGKIKESKSSPRVCSVCVCSCMPAPGRSLSFSCLLLVTLPVALAVASCQASTLHHPSLHPYP